jgi:sugar lactone lactonase YvrE
MKKTYSKLNLSKCSTAILVGASLLLTINTHAQIIYTIAGTGTAGYTGDGVQATSTQVNQPSGVAIDKHGNVFIADNLNSRIRKVDASTGIITTVAGTGTAGYNGDGILATAAELAQPWNVALDTAGNIYIGDRNNQRVRKITISTGIISTIAGTGTAGYNGDGIMATTAELNYPQGLCIDKAGNVYLADVDGERIRKINTSGIISTIAGTGTAGYNGDGILATAAQLHNPETVCLDTAGNIYISDYFNNEIRKVTVSTGIITSVAGNGTGGYTNDGILATASELYNPTGVSLDAHGNIYIADYSNYRIREVNASTGIITTVAGDGTQGYNGDGILATSAEIYNPWDVAVANNAFYFAEFNSGGNRVRKVVMSSTGIEQVSNGINVMVYPNPVSQNLNIKVESTNGKINFTIFNTLGQQVLQEYSNESTTNISVANLSPGIYLLRIQTQDGNILTRKISVIR